ncbi:MAG TPA: lysophospholipid acyltransferase family protein [Candidatus Syntrophosphaera sp.]|jgi:1-acyl-sn-glycerol-3-phosphate acyltransferase|nr:lysophospholipid acyltransferase family protein [Candidatus Syntrophosphaera sp.]
MWLIKAFHFIWHALILARFFCRSFFIRLFAKNPIKRRWLEIKNTTRTCQRFVRSFHIKLNVKNAELLKKLKDQNYLVVGNHASLLDIFVLAAMENYVFITSKDMSETPVLGSLVRHGGCIMTDRKKKVSLPAEIKNFTEILRSGFKVALFPEQSGTDGSNVNEFRKSLFQVAVDACCTVVPVCIRYLRLDGKQVNDENRSTVCWYRGVNFLKYYWNLIAHRLEAELCFLNPVEYDPNRGRGELSDLVYEQVKNTFHGYEAQPT